MAKRPFKMVYLQNPKTGIYKQMYRIKGEYNLSATGGLAPATREDAEQLVKDNYVLPTYSQTTGWNRILNAPTLPSPYTGSYRGGRCVFGALPPAQAGDPMHMYPAIITPTDPWAGTITMNSQGKWELQSSPWPQLQGVALPVDTNQVIPQAMKNKSLQLVGDLLIVNGNWKWNFAHGNEDLKLI